MEFIMNIRSTAAALATVLVAVSSVQATAQVSLYRDCNYGGGGATLGAARIDTHQMASVGLYNDDISAMIVDEGYAIVYYVNSGFQGEERIIWGPEEVPCLIEDGSNDRISSFIIEDQR
jgi:hypothetical protein